MHVQMSDLSCTPEELVKRVRPEAESAAIDVMAVEDLSPGTRYRVDVETKTLISVKEGTSGAGGGFLQLAGVAGGDPEKAQTVMFEVRQKKQ